MTIPGIFSPVLQDGNVLVDGGAMNNFPIDVLRGFCPRGHVIGVQASPPADRFIDYEFDPGASGWQILRSRLNPLTPTLKVPSIASILLRSVEVKDAARAIATRENDADTLICPDTSGFKLLDFSAFQVLAEAGYRRLHGSSLQESASPIGTMVPFKLLT